MQRALPKTPVGTVSDRDAGLPLSPNREAVRTRRQRRLPQLGFLGKALCGQVAAACGPAATENKQPCSKTRSPGEYLTTPWKKLLRS
jgi:hypothetical protein